MAGEENMISPFEPDQIKSLAGNKVISYGTSSYGYDVRCSSNFKVFTNINSAVVDPKNFDKNSFVDYEGDTCIIPPNSFALASTIEYFKIPRSVLTICLGKSTYARCGIIVNVTPLEPEWEGHVTLEFSNTTTLPAKIYANEGVAQFIFVGHLHPTMLPQCLGVGVTKNVVEGVARHLALEQPPGSALAGTRLDIHPLKPLLEIPVGQVKLEQPRLGALPELLVDLHKELREGRQPVHPDPCAGGEELTQEPEQPV